MATASRSDDQHAAPERARARAAERADSGWVWFAGAMIGLFGAINIVYGIAAIDESRFYVAGAEHVIGDLRLWGWFLLVVGAVQLTAGAGIFAASNAARWVGIVAAAINAL